MTALKELSKSVAATAYVAVTDYDWYTFLTSQPNLDEVNFWQPSGKQAFRVLKQGEPFLFKLHSPRNFVVGGGFFVRWTPLPVSFAWDAFLERNGARSLEEMLLRIQRYSPKARLSADEHQIGCVILSSPFFFAEEDWIPIPSSWSQSIQRGKSYDLLDGEGQRLWELIQLRFAQAGQPRGSGVVETHRYGKPITVLPRYGQGTFRVLVTDAYQRRCAVTGERVLPALEASHIKPFADDGPNDVSNGLLLRSDLHRLFDRGYITVDQAYRIDVSRKIRERFRNGREYYAFRGRQISLPLQSREHPKNEFLSWHNTHIFQG